MSGNEPVRLPDECDHVKRGKPGDGVRKVKVKFDEGRKVKFDVQGKPYEVGIDGRRACESFRPTNISPEEWKMSHTDRMLWEYVTAEAERDIA